MQPNVTFMDPQDERDLLNGRLDRLRVERLQHAHNAYINARAISSPQSLTNPRIDHAHQTLIYYQNFAHKTHDALTRIELLNEQIRRAEAELAALDTPKED